MARDPKDAFPCGMIYGIPNSYRWTPYHDLNEVLNTIADSHYSYDDNNVFHSWTYLDEAGKADEEVNILRFDQL